MLTGQFLWSKPVVRGLSHKVAGEVSAEVCIGEVLLIERNTTNGRGVYCILPCDGHWHQDFPARPVGGGIIAISETLRFGVKQEYLAGEGVSVEAIREAACHGRAFKHLASVSPVCALRIEVHIVLAHIAFVSLHLLGQRLVEVLVLLFEPHEIISLTVVVHLVDLI